MKNKFNNRIQNLPQNIYKIIDEIDLLNSIPCGSVAG